MKKEDNRSLREEVTYLENSGDFFPARFSSRQRKRIQKVGELVKFIHLFKARVVNLETKVPWPHRKPKRETSP